MADISDKELVRQTLDGDLSAFEALFDRYQQVMFSTAYRMVGDRDEAEDITQQVFVTAFERLTDFNPKYEFFSWMYRMTVNESIDRLKRRQRHTAVDPNMPDTGPDPERALSRQEISEYLDTALGELSVDHRVVVVLRHYGDLSYQEMGWVLEIPEKTVKSRLYAARQKLGKRLSHKGITSYDS